VLPPEATRITSPRIGLLQPEPTFPIADLAARTLKVRILPPYWPAR